MSSPRVSRFTVIFSLVVIAFTITPVFFVSGETYTLFNEQFVIDPQQPEIIAEDDFTLNALNEYVLGIPLSEAIGTNIGGTFYFEMNSTSRVEIYFLDSTGIVSDYTEFANNWDGTNPAPPTSYTERLVCDGVIRATINLFGIQPKLILFSNLTDVSGDYFWSRSLNEIEYSPYYLRSIGSDRDTFDSIRVFNINASVDVYVLNDEQYDSWQLLNPNEPPSLLNRLVAESGYDVSVNFTATQEENTHLVIWHELLHDSVTGTIYWTYNYDRSFGENYWSLIVVILLLIIMILTFVFQKQVLPPVVWTLSKAKYYLLEIPWKYIKKGFSYIGKGISNLWAKMRGVEVEEDFEEGKESEKAEEKVEE